VAKKNADTVSKVPNDLTDSYAKKLSVELVKKIYSIAKQNNIYFILLDIPNTELEPSFPILCESEYENLCDVYFNSSRILKDYQDLTDLYRPHGLQHWSTFSHLVVGKNLGRILENHLKNHLNMTSISK